MINRTYEAMLSEKDIIFEIFQYSLEKAKVVGSDNIYDFSLGNPSVPAPQSVHDAIIDRTEHLEPLKLHGYSPSFGVPETREAIAASLNERFRSSYKADNIFITIGAAGALAHALRAVTNFEDEVLTFAPHFPEYKPYVGGAGASLKVVPADTETFQIDFEKLAQYLNPAVSAVLINSPNNPSGIVYSTETIKRLSDMLTEASKVFNHPIYLISDEPYREILFEGTDAPFIANYYPNTIVCYSFSKSLSLPGERIGYLAVNPDCQDGDKIIEICPQISRTIGHNGASSLMQRILPDVCRDTSDLSVYETNAKILYQALTEYGYSCVKPNGSFYMFPRSLEEDSYAFCAKARDKNLMLVPGDVFGCPGHFRIAYCVPTDRVIKSLPVFKELAEEYGY